VRRKSAPSGAPDYGHSPGVEKMMKADRKEKNLQKFYKTHTWISHGYPNCYWKYNYYWRYNDPLYQHPWEKEIEDWLNERTND